MTIGELARAANVRTSTLRFYERRGLLVPAGRSRSGYRRYAPGDVDRVRFLRRAQELGFSLAELQAMLTLSAGTAHSTVTRADVVHAANEKLAELDRRIEDLGRVRRAIDELLAAPCLDPTAPCPIIASLAAREPRAPSHPRVT